MEKGRTDGPEKDGTVKIGVSIHSAEEAKEAVSLGASYLTAGHIFTTDCKKGVPARGLEFLKEVCEISPGSRIWDRRESIWMRSRSGQSWSRGRKASALCRR